MDKIHRALEAVWLGGKISGSGGGQAWAGALVLSCEPRDQSVVTAPLSLYDPVVEWAITHVVTAPAMQAMQSGTI